MCSKTENSELFDAILCGLGQFGILLSVTIPLVDAKKQANMYLLSYEHSTEFFQEQKRLYELKVFDHLKGMVQKKDGKWEYIIEAVCYFDEKEPEIISETLKQLHPNNTTMQNLSYWDFQPLFVKPVCDTFYLLGVLYNTSFEASADFPYSEVIKQNKSLFGQAKALQGCRYPVDAISFNQEDWRTQYGSKWEALCLLKEKYDPQCLLSTGHKLFPKQTRALNDEVTLSFK